MYGGEGDDTLDGGADHDILYGGDGEDYLYGRAGNDILEGGADNDVLEGGAAADILRGGEGRDRAAYTESAGGVTVDLTLTGEQRRTNNHDAAGDTLEGIRDLEGSDQGDTLTGNGEHNWLIGGAGADTLRGGGGNDWMDGGAGIDTLYGGTGADEFIFEGDSLPEATGTLAGETDVVKDFSGLGADGVKQESEEGDKLDLSRLTEDLEVKPTLTFIGTTAFSGAGAGTSSVGEVRYAQDDQAGTDNDVTHVTADLDGDGDADFQVTLEGLHTLTGADLILA